MFFFNTLNLNQISGGNQVKQGDFGSTFAYNLADEKSREIDIFDKKTAYINLVLNDTIVFTTTVIVDGSTVTFNIDKAISTGLYFLEIKIDEYIFPSDRQTIILVTAGSVAYDLKELVPNYDTNMTIASILSDLSQKGIDLQTTDARIDNIIANSASTDGNTELTD
jgi:archaellum component FlaF (FlaF/FlaG flagellin family)